MLTAAQLVTLACQICKCPGRTTQAGQLLNVILANRAQVTDLDTIRLTTTLSIGPQNTTPFFYSLPANYLRAYDVFYNVLGEVCTPEQWALKELDAAYTASGISNYPNRYATDMASTPPSIAFYPPPATALDVTIRYRPQTTDIVTPESSSTIPWFPNQRVLLKELCMELGEMTDDLRVDRWERQIDKMLDQYLIMKDDSEGYSQIVQLDSRFFKSSRNLPPSKILGF